jgi:hypothetical protein
LKSWFNSGKARIAHAILAFPFCYLLWFKLDKIPSCVFKHFAFYKRKAFLVLLDFEVLEMPYKTENLILAFRLLGEEIHLLVIKKMRCIEYIEIKQKKIMASKWIN